MVDSRDTTGFTLSFNACLTSSEISNERFLCKDLLTDKNRLMRNWLILVVVCVYTLITERTNTIYMKNYTGVSLSKSFASLFLGLFAISS